jgi:predicted small secreted protein
MKRVKLAPLAAALLCVLTAAACNSDSGSGTDPGSLLASTPPVPLVTEPFTGTVQPGSSDAHTFTVTSDNFQIAITMTAVGPPATIQEGLGVGQMVGGTCQLLSGASGVYPASTTAQLAGTIGAGTYCVMVYDAGNQTGPVTYAVTVQHY